MHKHLCHAVSRKGRHPPSPAPVLPSPCKSQLRLLSLQRPSSPISLVRAHDFLILKPSFTVFSRASLRVSREQYSQSPALLLAQLGEVALEQSACPVGAMSGQQCSVSLSPGRSLGMDTQNSATRPRAQT